jgi:hypothetical protein
LHQYRQSEPQIIEHTKSSRYTKLTWLDVYLLLSFLLKQGKDYGVLTHFQQYFSYIVVISFIGGGNPKKTTDNSLTYKHNVVSSTPCNERDSNLQLHWWYALIIQVVVNPTIIRSRLCMIISLYWFCSCCLYSHYHIWVIDMKNIDKSELHIDGWQPHQQFEPCI